MLEGHGSQKRRVQLIRGRRHNLPMTLCISGTLSQEFFECKGMSSNNNSEWVWQSTNDLMWVSVLNQREIGCNASGYRTSEKYRYLIPKGTRISKLVYHNQMLRSNTIKLKGLRRTINQSWFVENQLCLEGRMRRKIIQECLQMIVCIHTEVESIRSEEIHKGI